MNCEAVYRTAPSTPGLLNIREEECGRWRKETREKCNNYILYYFFLSKWGIKGRKKKEEKEEQILCFI